MTDQDKKFQIRLLATFKEEARERIGVIAARLGDIERATAAERTHIVEVVFREAHSLKAAARAVNQKGMEVVCQAMENVLAAIKRGEIGASTEAVFAPLWAAADALSDFLAAVDAAPDVQQQGRAATLARSLDMALIRARAEKAAPLAIKPTQELAVAAPAPPHQPAAEAPAAGSEAPVLQTPINMADTVRLSVQRLGTLLLQVEEMLAEKLAASQLAGVLNETKATLEGWRKEWGKMRAAIPAAYSFAGASGAADASAAEAKALSHLLDWNETQIARLEAAFSAAGKAANLDARSLASKVDRLHEDVKKILTQKCATLFELFPRTVRDLARDQGKNVELTVHGDEMEVDRRVLEEMKDPLLHIVRNCVDHGIETPAERVAGGKPQRATITLTATPRDNDKIEFAIADDGRGISADKLAATAVRAGLFSADQVPANPEELYPLIFQSGISTSALLTDISGRGLGLAIVREKVERLGGSVSVESKPGQGTAFRIIVPLTLAAYRGITVRVAGQLFVLPTLNVERVLRVERATLSTVENRKVINVEGAPVSLVTLADVLELPPLAPSQIPTHYLTAIVLHSLAGRVAYEVEAVEGDQEILVKPMGKSFARVRNVQGAAILSAGMVAPILNANDLLKSAMKTGTARQAAAAVRDAEAATPKNILVAEDSITARGLLRNILESAGYTVKTAVDGLEAWGMLKLEAFDLLVSDVEMPGMNGFDLTSRIRADKALSALPVVLVTALDSHEDRARGVDAGANAYILKGGFERGRLLDVIKRLV